MLTSPDRVVLVRGAAGTGKTTIIPRRDARPECRRQPRGVGGEGFAAADTVSKFLADEEYREHARGGVVWADEAVLLGAPTLARVFEAADELDARVVLMGDAKQHASVERGSALRTLETLAGLPVAEVTDVRRQRGADRHAVEALSTGDASAGFDRLAQLGWVTEVADDATRDRRIGTEYAEAAAAGESVLVVAVTHAEGERVTAVIRQTLKRTARLGGERVLPRLEPVRLTKAERGQPHNYHPRDVLQFVRASGQHKAGYRLAVTDPAALPLDRFAVYHVGELAVAVGDQLRITANGRTKDGRHRLKNGAVYTVAGFTPHRRRDPG